MNRKLLQKLTLSLSFVGLVTIVYVVFDMMKPAQNAKSKAEYIVELKNLEKGKVLELNIAGGPLFILTPSKEQIADLRYLDDHVWTKEFSGYNESNSVFVQRAISTIAGCALRHHTKRERHPMLKNNYWLGGYFDVCHDGNFDYAGRAIKTYQYSFNGGVREIPNLLTPKFEIKNNQIIIDLL